MESRAYHPTARQELLLKAIFQPKEEAILAWRAWNESLDLDHLDHGSTRLLPLLAKRLPELGIEDANEDIYVGAFRKTHYLNHLAVRQFNELLHNLQDRGMEVLLLKGVSLILQGAYRFGERPMMDLDILVRDSKVEAAFNALLEMGYSIDRPNPEKWKLYSHSIEFVPIFKPSVGVDLHWRIFPQQSSGDAFFEEPYSFSLNGTAYKTLSAADHLVHLCEHGARWNTVPTVRWAADSMKLLGLHKNRIDWSRVGHLARTYHLSPALLDTLGYLSHRLGARVPSEVLQDLAGMNPTRLSAKAYRVTSKHNQAFDNISAYWYNYLRTTRRSNRLAALIGFPEYLTFKWKKDSVFGVYRHLINWAYQDVKSRVRNVYRRMKRAVSFIL